MGIGVDGAFVRSWVAIDFVYIRMFMTIVACPPCSPSTGKPSTTFSCDRLDGGMSDEPHSA